MTPPAHFALSEILIVIAGAYSIRVFLQHKLNFAAAGVLVLAVAAFLATLRFGLNMHTELKSSHQLFTALSDNGIDKYIYFLSSKEFDHYVCCYVACSWNNFFFFDTKRKNFFSFRIKLHFFNNTG